MPKRMYRPKKCNDCPCCGLAQDPNSGGWDGEHLDWCGFYAREIPDEPERQTSKPEWCKVGVIRFERG